MSRASSGLGVGVTHLRLGQGELLLDAVEHRREECVGHPVTGHVHDRDVEAARLQEVPLHVDDHQRGVRGFEAEGEGLGGEFDATNVVDKPALTVITPVSPL